MKSKEIFNGFISVCTLLTLLIVIMDYFGFGKEFWKVDDPASVYSESREKKEAVYRIIEEVANDMELNEEKKQIAIEGQKALRIISFHIEENTKYALNALNPDEKYYSRGFGVLFYTSHVFSYNENKNCKKLTIEWPEMLKTFAPIGTNIYCLIDGEWEKV